MENKVINENLKQIAYYNKKLANNILITNIEKSNIQIAQNECGQYNLILNSTPLHSTIDAELEAKNIAKNIIDKDNSIRIIYGLGLGYLLEEISKKITLGKIFIYEPNIEILKFVFSIAKIDSLFNKNVFIFNSLNDLKKSVSLIVNEKTDISISFLNSYKNLYLDDIKFVLKEVENVQGELIANKNTLFKKAPSALLNTFANFVNIVKNPDISQLKNIYKDKVALILCAGPSLKDNIEIIKSNQDKFVLFALNPTVKLLIQNNIKPDFIVDIESFNTIGQFEGIKTEDYYFIMESFCHFLISRLKTKKTFNYISNNNFFNFWVRDCLKLNEPLETIGTVSYTALMSAYLMGFKKIILVGQDLAYKDGNCYSNETKKGSLKCIYDEEEKKYKIIAEDINAYIKTFYIANKDENIARICAEERLEFLNNNIVTVKSQDGKFLPTQTGYSLFIKYFEDSSKKLKENRPDIELYNASTGGAQIDGFENISLETIVKILKPIEKLDLTNYNANYDKEYILSKTDELSLKFTLLHYKIRDFININNKLLQELNHKNVLTKNGERILLKLLETIKEILEYKSNKETGYFVTISLHFLEESFYPHFYQDINKTKEILKTTREKIEPISNNLFQYICYLKQL